MRQDGKHFVGDNLIASRSGVAEIDEAYVCFFIEDVRQVEKLFVLVMFKQVIGSLQHSVTARMIAQFSFSEAEFVCSEGLMADEQGRLPEECATKAETLRQQIDEPNILKIVAVGKFGHGIQFFGGEMRAVNACIASDEHRSQLHQSSIRVSAL